MTGRDPAEPTRTRWQAWAMTWPLVCGAVVGAWFALQFAGPGIGSKLGAVAMGVLTSLPAGVVLGVVAIGTGNVVLRFAAHDHPVGKPDRLRVLFAGATGLTIAVLAAVALALVGLAGIDLWPAIAVGSIACVAAVAYFPKAGPPSSSSA